MELVRNKSYVHSNSKTPLIGFTEHELLEQRVEEHPDRDMYVFFSDNERITFSEYKERVEELASGLLSLGLTRGDCVAVIGGNHIEWCLLIGATRSVGIITVRLITGFTVEYIRKSLIQTSCKALFLTQTPTELYAKACTIIPELASSIPGELHCKEIPNLQMVVAVGTNQKSGTISLDYISTLGRAQQSLNAFIIAKKQVTIDDVTCIIMSSGTTGEPKAIPMTQFGCLNGAYNIVLYLENDKKFRRMLSIANMAYSTGHLIGVLTPLLLGVCTVFPSPNYSFEKLVQAVQDESCTDMCVWIGGLVDVAYNPNAINFDLTSLKVVLTGGSPISESILTDIANKFEFEVLNLYGSTESSIVSAVRPGDGIHGRRTVGRPVPHCEVQIVDDEGTPVTVGQKGEVWVRSPTLFKGYHCNIKGTEATLTKSGWVKMGDIGTLNADGYLTIVGRKKDIIIRNAINVYPVAVESVISNHPAIQQVQVVGVPDLRNGEEVCACITLNENFEVAESDIKLYCVNKIMKSSQPDHVLIFQSFPMGLTGKVNRIELRLRAIDRLDTKSSGAADRR